jgi:hypothetical protein
MEKELLEALGDQVGLELGEIITFEVLRLRLAEKVTLLINSQFDELVRLLYRVDVNESKLKFLLQEKLGDDAALIIADLLIERQIQKIATRRQFSQQAPDQEEDRW